MVSYLLGNYLMEEGILNEKQFQQIIEKQEKIRVKLGLIAVSEGMLTIDQADAINRMQQVMDKRFGDIAVEKGYLTDSQVGSLLKMQGNEFLTFAQTLVDEGIVSMEKLQSIMKKYQMENGFTNSEIEAIKSGEVDKIVPLFLPPGAEGYEELVTLAMKTVIRCVDRQAYPCQGKLVNLVELESPVTQEMVGDEFWLSGFSDVEGGLCYIASSFAKEKFYIVDDDVQDAVGEFVNCVNGLFATSSSNKGVRLELLPPELMKSGPKEGKNILILPIGLGDKKVELIVTNQKGWR